MKNPTADRSGIVVFFLLALILIVIDRGSKVLADSMLSFGIAEQVFPGFDLLLDYNEGAAFSFLSDAGEWKRWFLTSVSLIMSLIISIMLIKTARHEILLRYALAFILGGALGNFYDRLVHGYVVDFISVYFQQYRFATFNIADSAICIGAGLMILDILINGQKKHDAQKRESGAS